MHQYHNKVAGLIPPSVERTDTTSLCSVKLVSELSGKPKRGHRHLIDRQPSAGSHATLPRRTRKSGIYRKMLPNPAIQSLKYNLIVGSSVMTSPLSTHQTYSAPNRCALYFLLIQHPTSMMIKKTCSKKHMTHNTAWEHRMALRWQLCIQALPRAIQTPILLLTHHPTRATGV